MLRADAGLDVAVVSVLVSSLGLSTPPTFPMNRLGNPASLKPGATVYTVGFPNGRPWGDAEASGRFTEKLLTAIRFRSDWVSPGHSGGGLFDEQWNLLGLLQRDEPPGGKALGVRDLVELLRAWGYPVQLGAPAPPPRKDSTGGPSQGTNPPPATTDAWLVTGDHAMMAFWVKSESLSEFKELITSAYRRLREGGSQGEGTLRAGYWLLEDIGDARNQTLVPFMLLASPAQPGGDYSPQNLVAKYLSGEDATRVRQAVGRRGTGLTLRIIADFTQPGARIPGGAEAARGGAATGSLPAADPRSATLILASSQVKPATPPANPAAGAGPTGQPLTFGGNFGIIMDYVKSQDEPSFSQLMADRHALLQGGLDRLGTRTSWKVYQSAEPFRDGTRLYVTVVLPVIRGQDYRESILTGGLADTHAGFIRYRQLLARRLVRDFRILVGPTRK